MEKRLACSPPPESTAIAAQAMFDLPAGKRLLLDMEKRTAIVLSQEEGGSSCLFHTFLLPPTAAPIFLVLLQTYPRHCTHRILFRALYPQIGNIDEQGWDQERNLAIPLIRRALKSLLPALRGCGLQAISLRGQGYVLAPLLLSQENHSR
jgi:hypothetical protein